MNRRKYYKIIANCKFVINRTSFELVSSQWPNYYFYIVWHKEHYIYWYLVKTYSYIIANVLQFDSLRYSLSIRQKISSNGEQQKSEAEFFAKRQCFIVFRNNFEKNNEQKFVFTKTNTGYLLAFNSLLLLGLLVVARVYSARLYNFLGVPQICKIAQ